MNVELKNKAIELRKLGKSYNEICIELKVPKSTISDWLSKNIWSEEIKLMLNSKVRGMQNEALKEFTDKRRVLLGESYDQARVEARNEFEIHKNDPFFMHVLGLYWGEGNKLSLNKVSISNSDAHIIRLFKIFLEKYFSDSNREIKAQILIYPDLDSTECIDYWSREINLSKNNFTKCTVIKGKEITKRLKHGVCILGFGSRFIKEKMLEFLRLMEFYNPN